MEMIRKFFANLFNAAASYPLAAAVCFLIGLAMVAWLSGGVSSYFERNRAKAEYEAATKENLKKLQAALVEADRATARSRAAEEKANAIIAANEARAGDQTKKDAAIDRQIEETILEGQKKNEQILEKYNNDLRVIDDMDNNERRADICARINRIAAGNPNFAEFRCEANANAAGDQ